MKKTCELLTTWTLPNGSTITFTQNRGKSLIRGMGIQAIGPYIDVTGEELDEKLAQNIDMNHAGEEVNERNGVESMDWLDRNSLMVWDTWDEQEAVDCDGDPVRYESGVVTYTDIGCHSGCGCGGCYLMDVDSKIELGSQFELRPKGKI